VKTVWIILACAGGVIALVFVFSDDYDKAFIAAAAGAVCWLLNYRQQLRQRVASRNEQNHEDEDVDEEVRS
jgi:hypothetical protein